MRFRILGPLEVRAGDGTLVRLSATKHRVLLVTLLLHANRPLPAGRLIDAVWSGSPPRSARSVLRTYVCVIRRALALTGEPADVTLTGEPGGYRLRLPPSELDVLVFRSITSQGDRALAEGRPSDAVEKFTAALTLWRGRPAEDVPLDEWAGAVVTGLEECRLAVYEALLETRLSLGQHAGAVHELSILATGHPIRERLWALWMLALHRNGQQAEALATFRRLRQHLIEELGVEPSAPLRLLHQQILSEDPRLKPSNPAVVAGAITVIPRQLPPGIGTFTGRQREAAQLRALMRPRHQPAVLPIAAISGPPGAGKSALATHVAHELAPHFPDGQLYADLRDHDGPPGLTSLLERFLTALGTRDTQALDSVDEASARFRSLSAGRRLLVLIDNAVGALQIRALLPGGANCAVLVTSQRTLTELDGATHLRLGMLPLRDAVTLLGRLAGEQRLAAEPDAASRVARSCGCLPLALRIAGARLASRPHWAVATLAERLAGAPSVLDELELRDIGLRAGFTLAHRNLRESGTTLDRVAAWAFPLFGLPEGPDLSLTAAARLLAWPEPTVEPLLERLVDMQLLDNLGPQRYRLHDLLRAFARERAAAEFTTAELTAALDRLSGIENSPDDDRGADLGTFWPAAAVPRPACGTPISARPAMPPSGQDGGCGGGAGTSRSPRTAGRRPDCRPPRRA